MNQELYPMIFKRKSFHLFRNLGDKAISPDEIADIKEVFQSFVPLDVGIKTAIRIVPKEETTCKRGQQYCILLYSEKKGGYLQNIGYLGEQLELFLVSQNIGTLWYGIGKTDVAACDGLEFVIMIAISKVDAASKFRNDMYKSKRKKIEEMWIGEPITGVTNIARFAPSACNTQPWVVEHKNNILRVFRYKKEGKGGIMPDNKISFYNQIDIGIFLCFLNLCLEHEKIPYTVEIFTDMGLDKEKTLNAQYRLF